MNELLIKLSLASHSQNSKKLNNAATVKILLKNKKIRLVYSLENPNHKLLIPATAKPAQRDGLWQHTCCEAFIAIIGQPQYLEFNFSPSGEWACYAFSDYRKRTDWSDPPPPEIHTIKTDTSLQLEATILLDTLPAIFQDQLLELGISTVLEDKEQNLAYLALAHSQETPDFHRREQWIRLTP